MDECITTSDRIAFLIEPDVPDSFATIWTVPDTPQVADHLRVVVAWRTSPNSPTQRRNQETGDPPVRWSFQRQSHLLSTHGNTSPCDHSAAQALRVQADSSAGRVSSMADEVVRFAADNR